MEDTNKPKRGRGRPANSNSFVVVNLDYLSSLEGLQNIPVSKKWLESCGVDTSKLPAVNTQGLNNKKLNGKKAINHHAPTNLAEEIIPVQEVSEEDDKIEFTLTI
jgi:hypothetical protein|tara:strand:+ start:241 stop:555 length:315 start_codon:yes stop_codon:yes gene_type:complete